MYVKIFFLILGCKINWSPLSSFVSSYESWWWSYCDRCWGWNFTILERIFQSPISKRGKISPKFVYKHPMNIFFWKDTEETVIFPFFLLFTFHCKIGLTNWVVFKKSILNLSIFQIFIFPYMKIYAIRRFWLFFEK